MGWTKETTKPAPSGAPTPRKGQTVRVHCTGIVQASGYKFWSTKDDGQDIFSFQIGRGAVIPAWDEGVMTMAVGESATITATSDVAYGANGFPAWKIPGNATLIFHIELLSAQ